MTKNSPTGHENATQISDKPVSTWPCVNHGGAQSRIRLNETPVLETSTALPPDAVRALSFWSARVGEIVSLTGPDNVVYRARIVSLTPTGARAIPFERLHKLREAGIVLSVFQALPQRERFELVLEKLTELGVGRIVPFTSRHSITLDERDAGQKKSHRWPDVVRRAAKQCRRDMLPELAPVQSWSQVLAEIASADLRLMLYEGICGHSLERVLRDFRGRRVSLLVGPEGGFSEGEVEEARSSGIVPVSLGPRILRTETASIVGSAILQFCLGELE